MKQTQRSHGFSVIEIIMVVAVVGLIGVVGFLVYNNSQQAASQQKQESTAASGNEDGVAQSDAQAAPSLTPETPSTNPDTPSSSPAAPSTAPQPSAQSPAAEPKAWEVVHPNTDTCLNNQTKTVYVSESTGAYVYNSDFSATGTKLDYKTAKSGTCVYLSNGTGWIKYGTETQLRWQDVSITAP